MQAPHESPVPHIPPHQHLDVVDVVHISRHGVRHAAVVQRQQAAGLEARGEEPPERGERAQGAHGQCGSVGGGEGDFGGPKRVLRQLFREELRWRKSGMKGAVRWGPEMGGDGGTRGGGPGGRGNGKTPTPSRARVGCSRCCCGRTRCAGPRAFPGTATSHNARARVRRKGAAKGGDHPYVTVVTWRTGTISSASRSTTAARPSVNASSHAFPAGRNCGVMWMTSAMS